MRSGGNRGRRMFVLPQWLVLVLVGVCLSLMFVLPAFAGKPHLPAFAGKPHLVAHDRGAQEYAYLRGRFGVRSRSNGRARGVRVEGISAAARREALRSSTEYEHLSSGRSIALAHRMFPRILDRRPWRGAASVGARRVLRYLNRHIALVPAAHHRRAEVYSVAPLVGVTPAGSFAPANQTLVPTPVGMKEQSAPVPLTLPAQGNGVISLSDLHVGFSLVGATGTPFSTSATGLAAANSYQDTDTFVQPIPTGVETSYQLRSALSPRSYSLQFHLPSGDTLQTVPLSAGQPATGAVVMDAQQQPVAALLPATAIDARGLAYPVTYSVRGGTILDLQLHLPATVTYPLLVDPYFVQASYGQNQQNPTGPWQAVQGNSYEFHPQNFYNYLMIQAGFAYGSSTIVATGNNDFAYWYLNPPAPLAYIYELDLSNVNHVNYSGGGVTAAMLGLFTSGGAAIAGQWTSPNTTGSSTVGAYGGTASFSNWNFKFCQNNCNMGPIAPSGQAREELVTTTAGAVSTEPYVGMADATIFSSDNVPPGLTITGNTSPTGWVDTGSGTVSFTATDPGGLGMGNVAVAGPGVATGIGQNSCNWNYGTYGGCANPPYTPFTHSITYQITSNVAEGKDNYVVQANSLSGMQTPFQTFQLHVDHSPPTVKLDGSLYQSGSSGSFQTPLVGPSYPMKISASDQASGVAEVDVTVSDQSGKKLGTTVYDGNCVQGASASAGCDNSATFNYVFNNYQYPTGTYTITVTADDCLAAYAPGKSPGDTNPSMCGGPINSGVTAAHSSSTSFQVSTVSPYSLTGGSAAQNDTLGLEPFYGYRSLPTGAGSQAHVNLGTGNLVWQDQPISNPGVSLPTDVTVAYNSQQRLSDLSLLTSSGDQSKYFTAEAGYNQIGQGFSLGVDGLTRLNEPLDLTDVANGQISFTDIDGTRHTFLRQSDGSWLAPPGVFLHLRQWSQGVLTQSNFNRAWAITRPNGTTYFFDGLGYESEIDDRNINSPSSGTVITLQRKFSSPVDAASRPAVQSVCQGVSSSASSIPLIADEGCVEQVTDIVDEGGRDMKVQYNSPAIANGVPDYSNGAGLVSSITDHANHVLAFAYDQNGDLRSMTAASGEANSRTFGFGYGGSNDAIPAAASIPALGTSLAGNLVFPPGLTSITAPNNGQTTSIKYCAPGAVDSNQHPLPCTQSLPSGESSPCPEPTQTSGQASLATLLGLEPKCVTAVTDRGGGVTQFAYNQQQLTQPNTKCVSGALECTQVTGPQTDQNGQSEVWTDSLDQAFRPEQHVDPLGRTTLTTWNNSTQGSSGSICSTAQSAAGCESGPANTIAGVIKASGTSAQTTTLYSYEANGRPTERQGPAGVGENQSFRDIKIGYQESAGTLLAPSGADANQTFVADETSYQDADGNTTKYTLDPNQPNDGLVTQITDASGAVTSLGYTSSGLLNSVTRPPPAGGQSAATTYNSFDANGLPTSMTVAGQATNQSWRYQYDADGNLLAVTDPRNQSPASLSGKQPSSSTVTSPFTTYYAYNSLNERTDAWIAKDTGGSNPVWIHNATGYDANGNVNSQTDGNSNTTTFTYTPMDLLAAKRSPAVQDAGESSAQAEVTSYCYDLQGNMTAQTLPAGQPSSCQAGGGTSATNHATQWTYDAAGERVVEQRLASGVDAAGNPQTSQLTSWAYDPRGNQIGMSDPADNAGATVAQAQSNAQQASSGTQGAWRTRTTYDSAGQPIEVDTNPQAADGRVYQTRTQYDAAGNVVASENGNQSASPGGVQTVNASTGEFSFKGQPGMTSYGYDPRGLLTSAEDPNGNTTAYARQADGKICAVISPRGVAANTPADCSTGSSEYFKTAYTYGLQGWLTQVTLPTAPGEYSYPTGALTIQYARDLVGNPKAITDPRGTGISNSFYDTGDLKTTSSPWWWTYDPQGTGAPGPDPNVGGPGQVSSQTPDAGLPVREKTLTELYKSAPGRQQTAWPTSAAAGKFGAVAPQALPGILPQAGSTNLAYDGNMSLQSVTDQASSPTTLQYDPLQRLVQITQPFRAGQSSVTSFAYDADGNLASTTTPTVNSPSDTTNAVTPTTANSYDGLDRLVKVSAPGPAGPSGTPSVTAYAYQLAPTVNGSPISIPSSATSYTATQRITTKDPNGNSLTDDYGATGNLLAHTDQNGNETSYGYDPLGDRTQVVRPRGTAGPNAAPYTTTNLYDVAGRLASSTDGSGKATTYSYDPDGNLTEVTAPGAGATQDATAQSQITTYTYNGRGLLWSTTTGAGSLGSNNDGQNNARTTVTETDGNGNLIRQVNPAGVDASGAVFQGYKGDYTATPSTASGDPDQQGARANLNATINVYDANNQLTASYLPWGCNLTANTTKQSCVPTSASSSTWSAANNDDTRRYVELFGRTTDGLDNVASITQAYDWTAASPSVAKTKYDYYANGWLLDAAPPSYSGSPTSSSTYLYDPAGDQISTTVTGQDSHGQMHRTTNRTYWADGQLAKFSANGTDAYNTSETHGYSYGYSPSGLLVSLSGLSSGPGSGSAGTNETDTVCYDPAGRLTRVNESISGSVNQTNDTLQTFDADGNVTNRLANGTLNDKGCPTQTQTATPPSGYTGGSTTTFGYNNLDQQTSMSVAAAGQPNRSSTTSYWPSGQQQTQTRQQDGGTPVTENWAYYNDGRTAQDVRSSAGENLTYQYDTNGNRIADERGTHLYNAIDQEVRWTRGGPDTANPGSTVTYTHDGTGALLEQIQSPTTTTITTGGQRESISTGATTDYCSQATTQPQPAPEGGNCQTDAGRVEVATTQTQQTCSPIACTGPANSTITSNYCYNPFGDVTRITQSGCPSDPNDLTPPSGSAAQTTTVYAYNAFEQTTGSISWDPVRQAQVTDQNSYDGLDRKISQTATVTGGSTSTTAFTYLGLSSAISKDNKPDPTNPGANLLDTYDYTSSGQPAGFDQHNATSGTDTYRSFATDANGSIQGLENNAGSISSLDRYHYTPYGDLEAGASQEATALQSGAIPVSAENTLSSTAHLNDLRFEGFPANTDTSSYGMPAREYVPNSGIFTSPDTYEQSTANQTLQADPTAQSLYAFGGGNPTNTVEYDGHFATCGNSCYYYPNEGGPHNNGRNNGSSEYIYAGGPHPVGEGLTFNSQGNATSFRYIHSALANADSAAARQALQQQVQRYDQYQSVLDLSNFLGTLPGLHPPGTSTNPVVAYGLVNVYEHYGYSAFLRDITSPIGALTIGAAACDNSTAGACGTPLVQAYEHIVGQRAAANFGSYLNLLRIMSLGALAGLGTTTGDTIGLTTESTAGAAGELAPIAGGAPGAMFEKAGIDTTGHFLDSLAGRAGSRLSEADALDAYRNGRLYYDPATGNYVRYSSRTGVSVVTTAPTNGTAVTTFEGSPSSRWAPVPWRPGQ